MAAPILKSGVRVLRPAEFEKLREAASSLDKQTRMDGLLLSGLRYVEAQRFQDNPKWLDNRFIHIPAFAMKKAKRRQRERWVRLSDRGSALVPHFLETRRLPSFHAWSDDLRRWAGKAGVDSQGLGPKSLRKTWESWLVYYYPQHTPLIFLSQGHTEITSLTHYLNMPFTASDKDVMQEYVGGWEK